MHGRIGVGVVLVGWQLQYLSSRWGAGTGACLLAEEALKDWAGRTVGHEVAFFAAEEATWRAMIHLTAERAVEVGLLAVILVDVASESSRRCLSGGGCCCGRCGNSDHGGRCWSIGFVSGNLFIGFPKILLQDPYLVLHRVDEAFHFGI